MKKIIIFIHIYYVSQRSVLLQNLHRIKSHDLSIVLTFDPANDDAFDLVQEIATSFNVLKIVHCQNRGMDVMPFLKALNAIGDKINDYDIAIKYHTKNTHSQAAIDINSIYFKYLFDDTLLAQVIDQNLDFCAPLSLMRLGQNMIYRNRQCLEKILHAVNHCTNSNVLIDSKFGIQLMKSPNWLFSCGTMFVLSQRVLRSLQDISPHVCQMFEAENYVARTRDDGSIAHAMERYFGLHIRLIQGTYGFMHHGSPQSLALTKAHHSGTELELSCHFDKFLVKERADQLTKLKVFSLDDSDLDIACREMHARGLPEYNMSPLIKYYMYGDIYSVRFRNFEPSIFIISQQPKFIPKKSAFLQWLILNEGVTSQCIDNLSFDQFWNIGLKLGLVDIDHLYSEMLSAGFKVQKEYMPKFYEVIGSPLLMPTSKNFRPKEIPILVKFSTEKMRLNPLKDYISKFYLVHIYFAQNLMINIQMQDHVGTLNILRALEDSFGVCHQTAQVSACLSYVRGDIDSAQEHYRIYSRLKPNKNTSSLMPISFLRGDAIDIGLKLDNLFGSHENV